MVPLETADEGCPAQLVGTAPTTDGRKDDAGSFSQIVTHVGVLGVAQAEAHFTAEDFGIGAIEEGAEEEKGEDREDSERYI